MKIFLSLLQVLLIVWLVLFFYISSNDFLGSFITWKQYLIPLVLIGLTIFAHIRLKKMH